MLQKTSQQKHHKLILKTFKEIHDLVVPTMGAKGRLAVIKEEFEAPTLTDDGVTVAKQARYFEDFQQMVAISMIEAAANTEKEAYDGTTLTILLTYEMYKAGLRLTRPKYLGGLGLHPQQAADELQKLVDEVRAGVKSLAFTPTGIDIRSIAAISTKIPALADVVYDAYEIAGEGMNVIVEHDREQPGFHVQHEAGLSLASGYMSEIMRNLCNNQDRTIFENAHMVLFKEGFMTQSMIMNFFASIPEEHLKDPFVFVVTPDFNPEALKILINTLVTNKFQFQFIFISEERPEELFMDIAAASNGVVQDMNLATSNYTFNDCGFVPKIIISEQASVISYAEGSTLDERMDYYQRRLKDKYRLSINEEKSFTRRLSSLTSGLVKIQIGVPTITEYKILQLKLDDAIGAVRKSIEQGAVDGGGKALFLLSQNRPRWAQDIFKAPARTIAMNAGLKLDERYMLSSVIAGLDVNTGEYVDLRDHGIIDSLASVDQALLNACSIAASYLRSYTLIKRKEPTR